MDTAAEVLLIIVSSVLAIFLLVLTIAGIYLIRTLKKINAMADQVESTAEAIRKTAKAIPFVSLISRFMNRDKKRR